MQYLTFQTLEIPLVYVTGLSYAKTARLYTNDRGFSRFQGYSAPEISLRLVISPPVCSIAGDDYVDVLNKWIAAKPDYQSEPTQVKLGSTLIYPSVLFRMTSINRTFSADHGGYASALELDIVLSGVACAKAESRLAPLNATPEDEIEFPSIEIACKGKTLKVGEAITVSTLLLRPSTAEIELLIGDDMALVKDSAWLNALVENLATVKVGNYGIWHIVSASLVEGVLTMTASKWRKSPAFIKTYQTSTVFNVLTDILGEDAGIINVLNDVDYYLCLNLTPIEAVMELQASAGFLLDYKNDKISAVKVPSEITPKLDFALYLEEDLRTEPITGLIWMDGVNHRHVVGDNPTMTVQSVYTSASDVSARNMLVYMQYMQNKITVTTAIDTRIRHHSAFNLMKGDTAIPVMVEDYEIDWLAGTMTLELHYTEGAR